MANAGERLQVLLTTKNEISSELKQVKSDMNALGRTSADLHRRMEAGETGLQGEYEQTRRELEKNRLKQIELGRAASRTNSDIRKMTTDATNAGRKIDQMGRQGASSMKGLSSAMLKTGAAVAGVTAAVAASGYALVRTTQAVRQLINAAGSYEQSQIKIRQVFGANTKAVMRWSTSHSAAYGAGKTEVASYLASIQDLLVPLGFQREQAWGLTKDIGELIPALVAWDRQGRSVAEVNDIISAALTGEREALKSLGITISQDGVNKMVKQMAATDELRGATEEQAEAIATLTLIQQKSADAQTAYADNQNTISRKLMAFNAEVANLKEFGLAVLADGVKEVLQALFPNDAKSRKSPIQEFGTWLRENRGELVRGVVLVSQSMVGLAQSFVNAAHAVGTFMAWRLRIKAWTDIGISGDQRQAMLGEANAIEDRNAALQEGSQFLQDWLNKLEDSATALEWQNRQVKALRDAIAGIKDKEVKITIRSTMNDVYRTVTDAVQSAATAIDNNFAGGPITPGTRSWVGELGPELFVPTVGAPRIVGADGPEIRDFHTSGVIIPNHLLAPAMAVQAAPVMVPAAQAAGVQIGEVHVHDRIDLQREMDSFMARQRRIAAERS